MAASLMKARYFAGVDVWNAIVPLLQSGAIKPIVAKPFPALPG
jgi:hypothetical protein